MDENEEKDMSELFTACVEGELAGVRLDQWAAEAAGITRSRAEGLIKAGNVCINGSAQTKAGYKLRAGDILRLEIPEAAPAQVQAQDIDIDILYQDPDVAVVYKPSGMVVHPAAGNPDGTLVNALLAKLDNLSGIGGEIRPGIVHRIDKDTSGLLLIAKNDMAHVSLAEQIRQHRVHRAYLAIAQGHMKQESGTIDGPIGRHPTDRKRMAIVTGGREARTNWRVIEDLRGACLLECVLTTGRTHQIRVHMASIGHPLLGDGVYGPKKMPYPVQGGQLLHAFRIGFVHPRTGEEMLFEAPPEERFEFWHKKLKL